MPQLSGTIQDDSGNTLPTELVFMQANSSLYSSSVAYRPKFRKARSDINGKFSINLPAGTWDMAVGGFSTLQLTIPDTTQEYNVSQVVTTSLPTVPGTYLPLSGGTMSGFIVLHANPTLALHPVTKQYLEAWTGATTITTLGTITTGTWNGSVISSAYLGSHSHSASDITSGTIATARLGSGSADSTKYLRGDSSWQTLDKSAVGLGNVENTALSTWAGSTNLTTLGTITTGVWNGTDIAFANITQIATARILGRNTAGTGDIEELTASTVKTMLSLNNVENTALSTWGGSGNLITVGTITTGTWNGSTVGVLYGGTGLSTYAQGDILYASSSSVISRLAKNASSIRYLSNTGTDNNPAWSQVDLSSGVTGDLPFANIAQIATSSVLGRNTAGTGDIEVLTTLPNAVQDNITRLGTVTVGTWNGTAIAAAYIGSHSHSAADITSGTLSVARGGTGAGTHTTNGVLYGNGTSALATVTVNSSATSMFLKQTDGDTPAFTSIAASDILSGTIATARLGSGTATSSKFLRGDQSWAVITELGTVTVGTMSGSSCHWEGAVIDHAYGGTGANLADDGTYPVLGIVYKATNSAFGVTNTANDSILVTNGSGTPSLSTAIPTACRFNSNHIVNAASSTKTTAGAPYTNDGYVTITINGTNVRVMTTA